MANRNRSASQDDGPQAVFTDEALAVAVAQCNDEGTDVVLDGVRVLRRLLSIERNPPIDAVIETGCIPRLVQLLSFERDDIKYEAAWALTNIASGTSEHVRVLLEHNVLPTFVELLTSTNADVREQAVWGIGNIAGDSPTTRDMALGAGCLQAMAPLAEGGSSMSTVRNTTWALSNLCRGKPQPDWGQVAPAIPVLARLLHSSDQEVLCDALWALSYLSDGSNEKIQGVLDAGVCPRIVELLAHASPTVVTPALRTIGNIVTGDDMQTQMAVNAGVLPLLTRLINHTKKGIRKEVCWTTSNITAGNHHHIQAVLDSGIIAPLIHLLGTAEFDISKEAAWAISNATAGGTDQQILYLVEQGCVEPLCNLLKSSDARCVLVALEGLENILRVSKQSHEGKEGPSPVAEMIEEYGGLDQLESLQAHDNQEIYSKAVGLIEHFFEFDEENSQPLVKGIATAAPEVTAELAGSVGALNLDAESS
eukprot:CAMPEP_0114560658 /NCGR_PEP_ID=MMETSP0114-20121206/11575_1 /TAXON_ID=31324 /ORGANISM="Goniomonas sp, Strain m" /LENGTH=478 /DNA_ID=CAMNT_0001746215 /DNA_START=9 /DNA_END=1445 /DNA_ORIENTATION=+